MSKVLETVASKIEKYLQNDCADEWHVKVEGNYIIAYYTNIKEFSLIYDTEYQDWYISGEDMYVDMITEINKILVDYTDLEDFD